MAFATLEDLHGNADLLLFPSIWKHARMRVKVDQIVVVRGKVQVEEDQDTATILVDSIDVNLQVATVAGESHASPQETTGLWQTETPETAAATASALQASSSSGQSASAGEAPTTTATQVGNTAPPPPPTWEDDLWEAQEPTNGARTTAATNGNDRQRTQEPRRDHSRTIVVDVNPKANWQETFKQIVSVSHRFRGPDTLLLNLVGENLGMDFSEGFTLFCPELEDALSKLPGVVSISCR